MSLILIGCMRGVAVHAGETGEIINPSFEIWETGEGLDGWTKSADTTAGAVKPAWSENDAQDGNYNLACWAESDYHVDIYQDVKGLEPGYYYLTAYAQNGGGQKSCSLYAGGSGQSYASTMIPVSEGGVTKGWRGVTVRGIEVKEDGALRIGLRTDAYAGNWMKLDNLNLVRETNQETPYEFLKGGDISELTWLEDSGAVFYDENGSPKDALQILADSGFNFARLRLYNAPGKGKGNGTYYCKEGYQDLPDILSLAKRASDKGMELELSFHYSDYWSNGETQNIPKEWQEQIEGMSEEDAVDKLCSLVYDYTYEVMKEMESQGTVPAFVSLGNEIQSGMLFPYGKASSENWKYLARFLTSGSNAVKAASPETKVIIHLDGAGDSSKYTGFFDNCESFGVPYDIIGPSYYPFWTDCDVDTIVAFCNDMVERYDKDIMIMETGYNFNPSIQTSFPFMTACLSVYHKHRKLTILAFFQLSSIFFRIFTVLIQFVPLNSGRNIIYSMNCIRAKLPIMIPAVHTIHARLPCRVQPLHTGFMPDPEGFLILSGKLLVTSRLRPLLSCPEGLRLQPAPI